ncbi:MAG: gliding motility-associated C-terminal domain-containing protein [Odoribacter sp.]
MGHTNIRIDLADLHPLRRMWDSDFQYLNPLDPASRPYLGDKSKVYYKISGRETAVGYPTYEYALSYKQEAVAVTSEEGEVTVTITDQFGFEWTSKSMSYISYIPDAEAELKLLNTVDIVGEVNDEMGQAPLEVQFLNNSRNAGAYEWLLYKDSADIKETIANLLDSLIGGQIRTESEFLYTYENTGRYKVRLIAINTVGENGCRDTTDAQYVNVIESLVDVPNVFTPNGDGKNDLFKIKALSVENFQIVILNRWGRKVYEGNNPQESWDGRIHGKYATPGTYFYIVTTRGREKNTPPKYLKRGALLLVR